MNPRDTQYDEDYEELHCINLDAEQEQQEESEEEDDYEDNYLNCPLTI